MKQSQVGFKLMFASLLAALVLPLTGFAPAPTVEAQAPIGTGAEAAVEAAAAGVPLSDAEVQGILYMREEEKLARDVYTAFYEMWELPVFENIAGSEQAHMDAIKTLIDRYRLTDPAGGASAGEFADADLQVLYDELVARGSASLTEALTVGALIEELDISDLQQRLPDVTHADVTLVYENLLQGSTNHLRAFVRTLRRYGEDYASAYLSEATFDELVAGSTGRSFDGRGGRWGRGR